jgi:hypothetical protein
MSDNSGNLSPIEEDETEDSDAKQEFTNSSMRSMFSDTTDSASDKSDRKYPQEKKGAPALIERN